MQVKKKKKKKVHRSWKIKDTTSIHMFGGESNASQLLFKIYCGLI